MLSYCLRLPFGPFHVSKGLQSTSPALLSLQEANVVCRRSYTQPQVLGSQMARQILPQSHTPPLEMQQMS